MKFVSFSLIVGIFSTNTKDLPLTSSSSLLVDGFSTKHVSFHSSFVPRSSSSSHPTSSSSLTMLVQTSGGMLELEDWLETSPDHNTPLSKTVRKSPQVWKLASYVAIPASAALGYAGIPSPKVAVSAMGALATGMVGWVGRNKMTNVLSSSVAARPAIVAKLIECGLSNPSQTAIQIQSIRKEYHVHPEDFGALCTDVYRKYFLGMIKFDTQPRTSELTELENLKEALMLDNIAVGEAHMLAASDWFREACLFKTQDEWDDEDSLERKTIHKILYLTERALRQNQETDGAFLYEMTRTAQVFNITYYDALERIEDVAEAFYERALWNVRQKVLDTDQVSASTLERARLTLGVTPQMGFDLHEAALHEEVQSLLKGTTTSRQPNYNNEEDDDDEDDVILDPKTATFPEGTLERLEKLRQILSLTQEDVEYEITSAAMPLFRVTALDALTDAIQGTITVQDAWDIMNQRREDLLIPADKSDELVSTVVINALGRPLEDVKKFFDVNNEHAVYSSMLQVLKAKDIVMEVLNLAGWQEDFYDSFCNPIRRQSVTQVLEDNSERYKVYDIFIQQAIRKNAVGDDDGKLTEEDDAQILDVRRILAIDDVAAEGQAAKNFGPKLYAVMDRAMREVMDDYTPELANTLQEEMQQVIDDYKINDRMIAQNGRSLYQQALTLVQAQAPAGVPTMEQTTALRGLQKLFRLDDKETTPMHLTSFGSVYRKSIEEAMSITGIIRPEYRQPLQDLRERLGVTSQQARELFLNAVSKRMIPMIEWISSEMERTVFSQQQLAQRRQKDMGEDYFRSGKEADGTLGLGAEINVLGDVMNLVDFYMANDIAEQLPIGTKKIEKTIEEDGVKKVVEEEVPIYDTIYPITALELGAVDKPMAELLFRQFVVGSFTTQGPNAVRYEKSRSTFGGILGLSAKDMEAITSTIGETVYDNYIGQSLRTKGALDQQDMMFLANLQTKLGLTTEQGEAMMKNAQRKILVEELDAVVSSPVTTASASIKAFREKINSMGLSLTQDLDCSAGRIARMFELEVGPALDLMEGDDGAITPDDKGGELVTEIQESLGMSEEDAMKIFETMILQRSARDWDTIVKNVRRGRISDMVVPLQRLVRFGAFLNGQLDLKFPEDMEEDEVQREALARKIWNVYDTMDFSKERNNAPEEIEEKKELLKTILSLS